MTLSWYKVAAFACGLAGVICVVANFFTDGESLGFASVPLVAGAVVLRIRSFFAQLNDKWMRAFDMGVQVGRQQECEEQDGIVMPFR